MTGKCWSNEAMTKTISKELLLNFLLQAPKDIEIESLIKFIELRSKEK